MTPREFTAVEMMTCTAARLFEDNEAYFIGFGRPQIAAVLAQKLHAPHIIWVYEYGTIAPQFPLPFEPLIVGDSKSNYRAVSWKDMNHVFAQASQGFIDYGMLGALQIDPDGNINSSYVGGTYAQPGRRVAGAGGANGIASLCWRTIFVVMQERRRFVPTLDFIISPGYLDGSPQARERAGLPAQSGPYRVVTPHGAVRLRRPDALHAPHRHHAQCDGRRGPSGDGLRGAGLPRRRRDGASHCG
jgi:glutaconate CoA-transferase, subunit B